MWTNLLDDIADEFAVRDTLYDLSFSVEVYHSLARKRMALRREQGLIVKPTAEYTSFHNRKHYRKNSKAILERRRAKYAAKKAKK